MKNLLKNNKIEVLNGKILEGTVFCVGNEFCLGRPPEITDADWETCWLDFYGTVEVAQKVMRFTK